MIGPNNTLLLLLMKHIKQIIKQTFNLFILEQMKYWSKQLILLIVATFSCLLKTFQTCVHPLFYWKLLFELENKDEWVTCYQLLSMLYSGNSDVKPVHHFVNDVSTCRFRRTTSIRSWLLIVILQRVKRIGHATR